MMYVRCGHGDALSYIILSWSRKHVTLLSKNVMQYSLLFSILARNIPNCFARKSYEYLACTLSSIIACNHKKICMEGNASRYIMNPKLHFVC